MQKTALRILGVFLILGGILMVLFTGEVQEKNRPYEVHVGTVINGNFKETDMGYMGGNQEADENMSALKGIGVIAILLGGGMTVLSFKVKSNQDYEY